MGLCNDWFANDCRRSYLLVGFSPDLRETCGGMIARNSHDWSSDVGTESDGKPRHEVYEHNECRALEVILQD